MVFQKICLMQLWKHLIQLWRYSKMIKDAFDYGISRVIIACGKTDLRMGKDGFVNLIRTKYQLNPLEKGTLFMFCGSSRKVLKILTFEDDGFVMITKYLIEGNIRGQRLLMKYENYHVKTMMS